VSTFEPEHRARVTATQLVADFLATFAIFAALIALVYSPARLATAAVFIALVAAAMGGRDRNLVPFAVALTAACWFAGMVLAIALERPIF
jgi:hypothetical protein